MASTHINITGGGSRFASDLRGGIDALRSVKQQFGKIDDVIEQIASGGDWEALATYLGFPLDQDNLAQSLADAETVYNLLQAATPDINSANIALLIDRLG